MELKTKRVVLNEALATVTRFVRNKADFSDRILETDPDEIIRCVKFIERVFADVVVVVCLHDRVGYVSEYCKDIIGYDCATFRSLSLSETLDLIHDDDVKGFRNCMEKIAEFHGAQYDAYKFFIYYRIKNPRGGFHYIQDEKVAVETASGKFVFITLLKNIGTDEVFSGVRLVIQKKIRNRFVTIDEFVPLCGEKNHFSPRQVEIVNLVSRGFSNKVIAERLNLSICTVKNHKQVIFKKISVRSSIEMLNSLKNGTHQNLSMLHGE